MNAMGDVLAVIDSRRDAMGDLDSEGRSLRQAYLFSLRNPHPDYTDSVRSQAMRLKRATDSLCCAGRVPVIYRERRVGGAS